MSFSDSNGGNWSILFDTNDVMLPFLHAIIGTVCHIRCHTGETKSTPVIGNLPSAPVDASDGEAVGPLVAGSTAGISFQAYEVGEVADNPAGMFQSKPFLAVISPEICKIK
jgi:hypothetical protein